MEAAERQQGGCAVEGRGPWIEVWPVRPLTVCAGTTNTHQQQNTTTSEAEVAEIQAIQRVGQRRRRQWLNEKLLRDLAGPMTVSDMASQFNPAPFGSYPSPSAFTLAAGQSALFDHFRSISLETESKVLEV
jgi:hypothetical protein